jgi:hypothetical protein
MAETKTQSAADKRRKDAEEKAAELAKEIEANGGDETTAPARKRLPEARPAFSEEDGSYVIFDVGEKDDGNWQFLGVVEGEGDYTQTGRAEAESRGIPVQRIRVVNKRFISEMHDPNSEESTD